MIEGFLNLVLIVGGTAAFVILIWVILNFARSRFWQVTRGYTQHNHCPVCYGTGRIRWIRCRACGGDGLVMADHQRPTLRVWQRDHPSADAPDLVLPPPRRYDDNAE